MSDNLRIRPALDADYGVYTRLFPELATGDRIIEPELWRQELLSTTLIAEQDGRALGYVYYQVMRRTGYVRHLVVGPDARRGGVGRALMTALRDLMRKEGCARWALNVKPDNVAAIALYEGLGFSRVFTSASLRFGWDLVSRLPAPEQALTARGIDPAEDAALEAALGLYEGQIASARALPGRLLMRLVDPAAPGEARLGLALFSPAFPGAYPFRVARPALARPLLEALRPHALPEHDFMQVVVEGDDALLRTLLDEGASLRMEILHLAGPLDG